MTLNTTILKIEFNLYVLKLYTITVIGLLGLLQAAQVRYAVCININIGYCRPTSNNRRDVYYKAAIIEVNNARQSVY